MINLTTVLRVFRDSTASPTYLAVDLSVQLPPTVWQCLRSSWQPSPTGLCPLWVGGPGTTCRTTWHLPSRCPSSA